MDGTAAAGLFSAFLTAKASVEDDALKADGAPSQASRNKELVMKIDETVRGIRLKSTRQARSGKQKL